MSKEDTLKKIEIKEEDIQITDIEDTYNIALVGDTKVGKTSLLERFCDKAFKNIQNNNEPIQVYNNIIFHKGNHYKIKFWDTKFIDNYFDYVKIIFKNCEGICFVASFDNNDSLTHVNTWFQLLSQYIDLSNKKLTLIINKSDLKDNLQINNDLIKKKGKDLQLKIFEVSAKNNLNIKDTFNNIIQSVIDFAESNVKNNKIYEDETEEEEETLTDRSKIDNNNYNSEDQCTIY